MFYSRHCLDQRKLPSQKVGKVGRLREPPLWLHLLLDFSDDQLPMSGHQISDTGMTV
jgi:hypothetical protein